jgi:hypothetical protein
MEEELRNKVYDWSLDLIKCGKRTQGLILMLATWNFARFRLVMTTFPLRKFEKCLNSCDFNYFKNKNFEDANLKDTTTKMKIVEIYNKLSKFKGIEFAGATKIMHFLCPQFFVMWDTGIRNHYQFGTSADDYYNFMKLMQKNYQERRFKGLDKNVTLPRAIDIYNLKF